MRWPWTKECLHEHTEQWEASPTLWMPWGSICVKCADCGLHLSQTPVPYMPPRMQYVDRYKALRAAWHARTWR